MLVSIFHEYNILISFQVFRMVSLEFFFSTRVLRKWKLIIYTYLTYMISIVHIPYLLVYSFRIFLNIVVLPLYSITFIHSFFLQIYRFIEIKPKTQYSNLNILLTGRINLFLILRPNLYNNISIFSVFIKYHKQLHI